MTGKNLEIISQIVLWYENSFRIDCIAHELYLNNIYVTVNNICHCFYFVDDNLKVILYPYLILKKMNERITDS